MKRFVFILFICILSGCESIPIRNGEIAIGKDSTAGIEDVGIGKIKNKF